MTGPNFDAAFDRLLGHEGGYSNHPSDPGGETMWGITARVARAQGYTGAMRDMPRDVAKSIYRKMYWGACRCDELPEPAAFLVFDAAVNSGVRQAVMWLQAAVGTTQDGVIGPATLAATASVNPLVLGTKLCSLRLDFMTSLPTWAQFGKGWTRRILANLEYATSVHIA